MRFCAMFLSINLSMTLTYQLKIPYFPFPLRTQSNDLYIPRHEGHFTCKLGHILASAFVILVGY